MKLNFLSLGLPLLFVAQLASAEVLSVKTATANFRELPNEASKIKFTADKFYPVEIVEKKAGWVKVKDFEGDTAWVAEKVLVKQASVVINTDRANIREQPTTTSEVLFKVERGEVFKVEERKDGWVKIVDARGDGGWIRSDMTWGDGPAKEPKEAKKPEVAAIDPKADAKAAPKEAPAQAKEVEPKASAKAEDKPATHAKPDVQPEKQLSEPEHLGMLCQAYLDAGPVKIETKVESKPADKVEKKADKKQDKKADKKPAKPAPKAQQKKASEKH